MPKQLDIQPAPDFEGDEFAVEIHYPSHVVITRTQHLLLPVKSEVPMKVIRNIMSQVLMREATGELPEPASPRAALID